MACDPEKLKCFGRDVKLKNEKLDYVNQRMSGKIELLKGLDSVESKEDKSARNLGLIYTLLYLIDECVVDTFQKLKMYRRIYFYV